MTTRADLTWPKGMLLYGDDGQGPDVLRVPVVPADMALALYESLAKATEAGYEGDAALSFYEREVGP